jgi:hypothetical protein
LNSLRNKRKNASKKLRLAVGKLKLMGSKSINTKRENKGSSDD